MRSYRQHCAVAKTLDLIGERWTLLIVRDLLLGPRRYTDLLAGLPGIGTNLLAARLRTLEREGLVRRTTPQPPGGARGYELTELGRSLEPAVLALGRFGGYLLAQPSDDDAMRPGWYVVSMLATFRPELAGDEDATYELRIDDQVFTIVVRDASVRIAAARSPAPTSVISTDLDSFLALLAGALDPATALERHLVSVEGEEDALARFVELFRWPLAPAVSG